MPEYTINQVMEAFGELKNTIGEIETKAAASRQTYEQKLAALPGEIEAKLAKINDKLDQFEARGNRLPASGAGTPSDLETKAFLTWMRGNGADELKTLQRVPGADGGFLVPEGYSTEMVKLMKDITPLRQVARVIPTSLSHVPFPRQTTASQVAGTAEGIAKPATNTAQFERRDATLFPMYANVPITLELVQDSGFPVMDFVNQDCAEEFAMAEAQWGLLGTGVGQPVGLLNDAGVRRLGGTDGATHLITFEDVINLQHGGLVPGGGATVRLNSQVTTGGEYALNTLSLRRIRTLRDAVSGMPLWQPGLNGPMGNTLAGRPYFLANELADDGVATNLPIVYGLWNKFWIYDKVNGYYMIQNPYASLGYVNYQVIRRVGMIVSDPNAFLVLQIQ